MNSMRVCVFHLSSHVASGQVSLPHEALASMFIDCLFYQVDFIGGDPNMALYRYSGTKQGSMDIQGGMYQSIITYFLDGWKQSPRVMPFCIPRAQHCSANSLLLLKQYEDALGCRPYKDCPKIDWNTFPGLDPMVATVLEWGHSMTDDQWTDFPEDTKEFKLSVSEWLLNSTSANYLLNDRDYDSHVPLLLTVNSTVFTAGRARQMNRNPDTLQEKAERRQGLVQALVALQPLVHNVLLNPLILPVESHLAREAKAAKERKEASPPRAKRKEASPPEAMENAD
ncbi:hypothetical protein AK812_SmicGene36333 [Symbiodinium microadriaticum]|uniref:Uncharacterized protein n=1 Tax=Symbiodinium microadriaticum TaxID=2951 RepID=A0A1Q9CJ64_SYMMI|nr:hypothetical protein AK812_SmicGene36333 [Symbiodinium microadriaticum]